MRWRRVIFPVFALAFLLTSSRARAGVCDSATFPRPTTYAIGSNQQLAGVLDVNGDTYPDLVIYSSYNETVSILYGTVDGSFQPPVPVPLPAGTNVIQVFAQDVTGDGHADLVILTVSYVSPSYVYSILVLAGNGNGTFQTPVSTTAAGYFGVSLLARLDDDALPDLVTSGDGTLQVYRNNGDGSFQPAVISNTIFPPAALVAGDFDGDGHPDIIAADLYQPTLSFFHGLGNGMFVFSHSISSGTVQTLRAADLDGDGHLDLAVSLSNGFTPFVGVALGNGNGTFDAFRLYARNSSGPIELGDLDGDGRLDIVGMGATNTYPAFRQASVWRNVGGGLFSAGRTYALPPSTSSSSSSSITLADVTGDGHLDLIFMDGSTVTVVAGDGAGGLVDSFMTGPSSFSVLADMNGDGLPDLVGFDQTSVYVYIGLGNGDFASPEIQPVTTSGLNAIAVADFNGDGHLDVVVTAWGSNYWVLLGNGDGTLQPPLTYSQFVTGPVYTGDFNGDGKVDLLLGSGSSVVLALGNGDGTFQTGVTTNLSLGFGLVVADFNRDGRDDVAWISQNGLNPDLLEVSDSNPDGTFQPPSSTTTGSYASQALAVADLNGDLYPDLVVGNASDGSVSIILSNGAGGFQAPVLIGTGGPANSTAVADFDGDGIPDIAAASDGNVFLLRGLPGGNFASPQDFLIGGSGSSLFLADIDGNGTPDLMTGSGWILLNQRLAVRVPTSVEVCIGSPAVLKAHAGGTGAIGYQWRKGGVPLSDGGGISGSHTATLSIAATTAGDAGNYDVVVTDACGTATSSVISVIVDTSPATPSISAPASAPALASGLTASVPAATGHVYEWSIIGGSISSGQGTSQITFAVGAAGTKTTLQVVDHTPGGCASSAATFVVMADFLDVPPSHPFHSFIVSLARNGITSGCGGGNFCPDSLVTRAQMAVFLLLGEHGSSYVPPPATGTVFTDVPIGSFAAAFIERLAAEAITGGCGAGIYCPSSPVTRAQMAVFLLRAEHGSSYTPPPATGAVFADVPIGSFAAAWIERLAAEGITAGCGGGNFCPGGSATRGQMAVFLTRTFNLP